MAAGDVYRLVAKGRMSGNEWVNVYHFRELSAGPDLGGLVDSVKTTVYDALKTRETALWSLDDITAQQLVVGGGPSLSVAYSVVGTDATSAGEGALTNAMVVSLRTGLAGRSHRGRLYLPIDPADSVNAGKFTTAFVTTVTSAFSALLAQFGVGGTDANYEWIVWSRKLGEIVSGGHVTGYNYSAGSFPINATIVDNIARVQRRREFGKGA